MGKLRCTSQEPVTGSRVVSHEGPRVHPQPVLILRFGHAPEVGAQ
jgi:hypothetical protein